jgi:hypothetical protein
VADLRVPVAPAMQPISTFRLDLCQPMTSVLPVRKRRLRHIAVFWAALGQAAACHYLCICGTEIETQGRVDNLIRGKRICHAWVSIGWSL